VEQDSNQQQIEIAANLEHPVSVSHCLPQKNVGLILEFEAGCASTAVSTTYWQQSDTF
jgi:hypothetical protein